MSKYYGMNRGADLFCPEVFDLISGDVWHLVETAIVASRPHPLDDHLTHFHHILKCLQRWNDTWLWVRKSTISLSLSPLSPFLPPSLSLSLSPPFLPSSLPPPSLPPSPSLSPPPSPSLSHLAYFSQGTTPVQVNS